MSVKAKWLKLGTVRKNAESGEYYIKIDEDITLTKNTVLRLDDPKKVVDRLVGKGVITADVGETRKTKIPAWLKYEVILPPNTRK